MTVASIVSMNKIAVILFLINFSLFADVMIIEEDFIHFAVPGELKKLPSVHDHTQLYVDKKDKPALILQVFRSRQWSDWHLRGLKQSKDTFQKFFDTELGGGNGEKLILVSFDDRSNELNLKWSQPDGVQLLTCMKLTSFGCIAVHVPFTDANNEDDALNFLRNTVASLKIPEKYQYVSKTMSSELMSNMGSGFYFLVLSMVYLMFSLFKRSQLKQMKLERRLQEAKAGRLQSSPH